MTAVLLANVIVIELVSVLGKEARKEEYINSLNSLRFIFCLQNNA